MAPKFQNGSVTSVFMIAAFAVVAGALLEGTLVGFAQARALRKYFHELNSWHWILATTAGAFVAWLTGMLPSTLMTLLETDYQQPIGEPPAWQELAQYPLAAFLGFILGPILGFAQSLVLLRQSALATKWPWANAFAWAVGMPIIFFGMQLVPWKSNFVAQFAIIILVCAIAGFVVGVIRGRFMIAIGKHGRS